MGLLDNLFKLVTEGTDADHSTQTHDTLERDSDADEELNDYINAANAASDAGGYINIGLMYEEGRHTPKNMQKALQCYKLAADLDNQDGCFLYATGVFDVDSGDGLNESGEYLKRAARMGHVPSMYKLGLLYVAFGYGFGKGKGYDWWEKAAKLGYAPAQAAVGIAYGQGEGYVDQADHKKACFWCVCAYLHGNGSAKRQAEEYLRWAGQNVPGADRRIHSLMRSIPNDYPQYLTNY